MEMENIADSMSTPVSLTKSQRRKARKKLKRDDAAPDSELLQKNPENEDLIYLEATKEDVVDDVEMSEPVNVQPVQVAETGFTVIGGSKPAKKTKLPPFLPAWYSSPIPISNGLTDSCMPVDEMPGLDAHFCSALREQGIDHFFPVQQTIIPDILRFHNFQRYYAQRPPDLCVCAPTGSGKTLAYAVPILQDLSKRTTCQVRALILLPVKELAVQVADVFNTFAIGTRVKIALVCGKQSLEQEREQFFVPNPVSAYFSHTMPHAVKMLQTTPKCAVDVIIATPGRLVDHLYETPELDLQHLEYLVVDEADRMIEEFKNNWFRQLERAVFRNPEVRPALDYTSVSHFEKPSLPLQKLLFSATLSYDPQRFEVLKLYRPKLFSAVHAPVEGDIMFRNDEVVIGAYVTPENLKEMALQIDPQLKPLIVLHLLQNLGWRRVLIFTNSLESTRRLFLLIKLCQITPSVVVHEISSNVHPRKRQASLNAFEKGNVDVIVASDSMARGIDLPNVDYVILYDVPFHAKTYIHRSGRTARAGKAGTTITLLKANEKKDFDKIMKELKKKSPEKLSVTEEQLSCLEEPYKAALQKLEAEIYSKRNLNDELR